ncbi:AI-2E family transporter [Candidatus Woesearchaeota archaeon]|nr:AI-2E family transporter [Candidatus Woesearchaeota archaeon]
MAPGKRSVKPGKVQLGKVQPHSKYLFILFFLAVLALAVLIIRPFISTLIISAVVAYVLYPVYLYFYRLTNMKGFSAVVLILLVLLLLSIPVIVVTGELTKESYDVYLKVKRVFLETDSIEQACAARDGILCSLYETYDVLSERYDLGFHLARGFGSVASGLVSRASDFILNIPKLLLNIFIALFAMYYMFVQGDVMLRSLKDALPLKEEHSDRMLQNFNDIIHATIYGAIVLAIVQGVLAAVGYFIFGISSPIILALLTTVAAFIPFLGAALVWLPVSISMLINGLLADDSTMMLKAGGLVLYGALVVSTIDNFLRPKIVGSRARVHPLVILLGVFGGLALFGFAGIMIGPLLLTLFIASLRIYMQEKDNIV